jgi:hypothetical protein
MAVNKLRMIKIEVKIYENLENLFLIIPVNSNKIGEKKMISHKS